MVGVHRTMRWVFDVKPTDIFWCTAEPGWITGHSYVVYGPLMAGTTTVLYEGHPLYPEPGRVWSMVERLGVTILYTAPTLVRMLMRHGAQHVARHDLTTLRLLATVGEPISPEAWLWFHRHVGRGRCPVLDTWWQTETGMIMLSPLPVSLLKPGSVTRPLPGIEADVVDEHGQPVGPGRGGLLVLQRPWPAMSCGVYNDDESYRRLYWERFPGWYCTGDVARRDEDGYFWIQGRADDVLLIAGHRIGTAEMEAALASHPSVAECAVIGVPDALRGEVAKAFVVLVDDHPPLGTMVNADDLATELVEHVPGGGDPRGSRPRGAAPQPQRQDHAPGAAQRGTGPGYGGFVHTRGWLRIADDSAGGMCPGARRFHLLPIPLSLRPYAPLAAQSPSRYPAFGAARDPGTRATCQTRINRPL